MGLLILRSWVQAPHWAQSLLERQGKKKKREEDTEKSQTSANWIISLPREGKVINENLRTVSWCWGWKEYKHNNKTYWKLLCFVITRYWHFQIMPVIKILLPTWQSIPTAPPVYHSPEVQSQVTGIHWREKQRLYREEVATIPLLLVTTLEMSTWMLVKIPNGSVS